MGLRRLLLVLVLWSAHAVTIDYLNDFAKQHVQEFTTALQSYVPSSIGACTSPHAPPSPCLCLDGHCKDLYHKHKAWQYTATGRWVSGLNTIALGDLLFSSLSNSTVALEISGEFAKLPLSLYIAECTTFNKCHKMWDNTSACCGSNKKFRVSLQVECAASFPYLSHGEVVSAHIDKLVIREHMAGIKVKVADITNRVTHILEQQLQTYLTVARFIPTGNGSLSLLTYLNQEIVQHFGDTWECPTPDYIKDARLA